MDPSRRTRVALRAALSALAGFALLHHARAAVDVYREFAGRSPSSADFGGAWADAVLLVAIPVFCTLLGTWVVAIRPGDRLAWILLSLMFSFGQVAPPPFTAWERGFREPAAAFTTLFEMTWPIWMLLFGVYFPEPLDLDRRRPWLKWIPIGIIGTVAVLQSVVEAARPYALESLAALDGRLARVHTPLLILSMACISGFFTCLWMKLGSATSIDSKRRLRLLLVGASVALTPSFVLALRSLVTGRLFTDAPTWIALPALALLFLFPVTLAYVIVVQHAMDVRVALRLGARYMMVTNGLRLSVFLVLLPAGLSIAPFILRGPNSALPLKIGLVAAYLTGAVMIRRRFTRIKLAIDRRFFREAYDEERVLTDLSNEVRTMVEAEPLLATVVTRVADALHVGRITVFTEEHDALVPTHTHGVELATIPPLTDPQRIAAAFAAARGGPLLVYFQDPQSWTHSLSLAGRAALAAAGAQLLLPLTARGELLGLVALGPKLSEQPYSKTDLRLLRSVAAQTGLALLNSRLTASIVAETAQRARLSREIEIAREVQQRLFPQVLPQIAGLDLAGACRPASGVAGDYYDFLVLPGGLLGVAVADVSGKGIPAALLMASLQACLRGQAPEAGGDMARLVAKINRLVHDVCASNRYATFFYGQYDPRVHRLDYVNAGHNPPMLLRRTGGDPVRLPAGGTVVGLFADSEWVQASVELCAGDVLVGFTDGISEALNAEDEEWGEDRLLATLRRHNGVPAAELIDRVFQAADAFVAGAQQHDDMTLIALRVVA